MATLPDVTSFYHQALIEAEVEFTPPVEELVQVNEVRDNRVPVVMVVWQDTGKEPTGVIEGSNMSISYILRKLESCACRRYVIFYDPHQFFIAIP